MTLRTLLKAAFETTMVHAGLAALSRSRFAARTIVFAYHNVIPDGAPAAGDTSLHLPRSAFVAQLDALAETHEIIALDQIGQPPGSSRPRAVLTFDDAYQGAVTIGAAELARRGLPGTFFVAPAFVGGGVFWWDSLSAPGSNGPEPGVREHALAELQGADAKIRAWAHTTGLAEHPVPVHARVASEAELAAAAQHRGITLASHTWSHPNLARLDEPALDEQLQRSLAWLRERYSAVTPWVSYPYGLSSPAVEQAAQRAGYLGGLTLAGSWLSGAPPLPFAVPRFNVPSGLSRNGFRLRAAGIGRPW